MNTRALTLIDSLIAAFDDGLRTALGPAPRPERPSPGDAAIDEPLGSSERDLSGRLMRVDHAGEVCAQALYRGQALSARTSYVQEKMKQAAAEENDHLAWTEARIRELGTHTSYLSPAWYAGSFLIGTLAGLMGDKWNLGFVTETERQVVQHLEDHLDRLPSSDQKSRAILKQMRDDEGRHATAAIEAGAVLLPEPTRRLMRTASKIMTRTAHWI
ncbi:MAG: 2-polyprenyl-3-methyl-6-methoxy-1,4-benzoquinone monooxygenase [Acidiferrobacterales bacterium]